MWGWITQRGARSRPEPTDDVYEGEEMDFLDHLEELRIRILRAFLYIAVASLICLAIAKNVVIDFLMKPLVEAMGGTDAKFLITEPLEAMMTWFKVDIVAGLAISLPFVAWEMWAFVAPALSRRERRVTRFIIGVCPALFLCGAAFIYKVFPMALRFLLSFATLFPRAQVMLRPWQSLTMMITLMLGMGLVFQMPLVIAALARFGLVSARGLLRIWRHAIVVIVTLAAIITPTWDPVNLSLVAVPMIGLFFLSVGVAALIQRREAQSGRPSIQRPRRTVSDRIRSWRRSREHPDDFEPGGSEDNTD